MGIRRRRRPLYPPGAEEALARVMHLAFIEIRFMAQQRGPLGLDNAGTSPQAKEYLKQIHMLANLGDQLPICLAAMVRHPMSEEGIERSLNWTWRVADPSMRQWLRKAFAEVGYDHRHLFPDEGDHDRYDQAAMLRKRIRKEFRPAAETALTAQGHDREIWEEDRWLTVEEVHGPQGPRPHVIFTFVSRSKGARWRKKSTLIVAVDIETNHAVVLDRASGASKESSRSSSRFSKIRNMSGMQWRR